MKKIILNREQLDILKKIDFSELGNGITFNENSVMIENFPLFCLIMTEEISVNGIEENYTPNAYGRKLESLYDYIYSNKTTV